MAIIKISLLTVNGGQEAATQEALELLIGLAGTELRFLRSRLVEVVGSMLQIAKAESLRRRLALEFKFVVEISIEGGGETLGGGDVGGSSRPLVMKEHYVMIKALEMEALVDVMDVDNG
ncbi:importin-5-like protein [Tanacetum coccineum]